MKFNIYKTIAYGMLILAFVLFSIQMGLDYQQTFNVSITNNIIATSFSSIIFSMFLIYILKMISNLQLFTINYNKTIKTIRTLIYLLISFMFLSWSSFLGLDLIFLHPEFLDKVFYLFFIKSVAISLIYSACVNIFFISLSIRLPKKEDKDDI